MAENKKPILAIRCAGCGAVYMAQALAYPISPEIAEEIAECVNNGDIPFIAQEVKLRMCKCGEVCQTPSRID